MKDTYYAVIFTSIKASNSTGYAEMAQKMEDLVVQQPGYLGHESAQADIGITISYWTDLASIKKWKEQADHQLAQEHGKTTWYDWYRVRVCEVLRDYVKPNS